MYMGLCVFTLPNSPAMNVKMCNLSYYHHQTGSRNHCLGLGHEKRVCTLCLSLPLSLSLYIYIYFVICCDLFWFGNDHFTMSIRVISSTQGPSGNQSTMKIHKEAVVGWQMTWLATNPNPASKYWQKRRRYAQGHCTEFKHLIYKKIHVQFLRQIMITESIWSSKTMKSTM